MLSHNSVLGCSSYASLETSQSWVVVSVNPEARRSSLLLNHLKCDVQAANSWKQFVEIAVGDPAVRAAVGKEDIHSHSVEFRKR